MAVLPPFIPAVAVAAKRRRIVRKFEEASADRPDRARTLEELNVRESFLVSRMVKSGVLVTTGGGRYYLSAEGVARWNQRRNTYVLIALGVSTVSVLAVLFFTRSR